MDDQAWTAAVAALSQSADRIDVLARCLAVMPQLEEWRRAGGDFAGGDAANALDQARGDLERLAAGEARDVATVVQALLTELPTPWE